MGGLGGGAGHRQDRERTHPLRAVDEHPFDVGRRRRAGVEGGLVPVVELRPAVGVVEIGDDVGRIERDDEVLCQMRHGSP